MVKGQITFESFETTPYYSFIIQVYTLNAETLVKKVGQLNEEELKKNAKKYCTRDGIYDLILKSSRNGNFFIYL